MNQRKYVRHIKRFRCWCESDGVTLFARVGNVSESGVYIKTSTPLPAGAKATVKFEGVKSFSVTACVVWTRDLTQGEPVGMGLKFEQADELTRHSIMRLIDSEK
jgi:uncharacterized protein (TIGR02266 family)